MTATAPPARPGRWLKVALVASLACNLLVLGVGAAAFVRHRFEAAASLGYGANLLGYAHSLPGPRRVELWRATKEERRSMEPLRAEVRAARHEWRDALVAEPFDAGRFARAQARLLEAENKARAEAQRIFLAIAAGLTAEERARFVGWQARETRRARWHRDRPRQDGEPR